MISAIEKNSLLLAFAQAEKDPNPGSKVSHYEQALELENDLHEQAETDADRRLLSNIRFANCRILIEFLATAGALADELVPRYLKLLREFRIELQALVEQNTTVRDQIQRFFEKQRMFLQVWAEGITKLLLGEESSATN